MRDYEDEVLAGIVYLTMAGPDDWRQRVTPTHINMREACDCVLGQVDGNFYRGVCKRDLTYTGQQMFGFMIKDPPQKYEADELREDWVTHQWELLAAEWKLALS